jgi:cytoskeletal protein RodZ
MKFSVGQRLRQARVEQGLGLETVAARTKISLKFLKAIESDDRSVFPSGFFYKSFVDQYARALSLDTIEIGEQVNELLSADAPLPLPGRHDSALTNLPPMSSSSRVSRRRTYASIAVLVVALAGCSAFYAWWRNARVPGTLPQTVRAQIRSQAGAVPVARQAAAEPITPAPTPAAHAEEARQPSPEFKVLLDLMARETTWLSASSDGKMVFQGILAANDTKTIEGKEFAKLRVGNAGGLEVRLNGKLLGALGERGQVLEVVFRRDEFEIVPPAPKESDD